MGPRRVALACIASQIAALVVIATPTPAFAAYPPSEWVIGPMRRVAFITLDGNAKNKHIDGVLKALTSKRAKVSFFLSGSWVQHHEDRARKLVNKGHAFGNRGFGTAQFTSMSDSVLRASIAQAENALVRVGARPKPFLRPPNGARDARVLRVAGSMGYRSLRWTYAARGGLARNVARKAVRKAQPGSIISLDTWRKSHRRALPRLIDGLRRRGFSLRTVDALENTHAVRWDVTLRSGSSGSEVAYLAKRLNFTSYPAGNVDGSFGYPELQATYAFEKTHHMPRDGVVTPGDMTRISMTYRPPAPKPKVGTPRRYVDVDIGRQVLFEVVEGKVKHTLPVSTGNGETYYVDGEARTARTPRGNFSIVRKIKGERHGSLGTLYWPNYFYGGYAVHGSNSVPTYPASHGCVRIPRYVERAFFYRNPIGTPVFVHD